MPQDLTNPTWYNDDTYIKDKVNECNTIKFGAVEGEEFTPWTADTVRDFLAQANQADSYAPWMGYDNFVTNGNAENCSPNPLFNVMEYVAAKANQLNAMNEGAGYEGNNAWTAQSVLDYFKAHNITAWDHFTTAGQFEDINPSNAMDLSEFLTKKAAQCNDMEFGGKSDWDEQAVLDYYQEHGLNAVMVAINANDPNVVVVPEDDQVNVPANLTPWGINTDILNDVNLTTGNDVVSDDGVPSNFVGEVSTSASKSTLNPGDQITGTSDADQLTVDMNGVWSGFRGDGFMKGVPTVNINNETDSRDLSFYANGIEGAETYNIDGNVSLYNLPQAGITVNLSNVDTDSPVNISFTDEAIKGNSDNLALGLNNVRVPNPDISPDGKLDYTPVEINANDIEHLTVNSTGAVENMVDLSGIDTAKDLTVTGEADLTAEAIGPRVKTIDATAATGDVDINAAHTGARIENATFGSGDDTLRVWNIATDAQIDGGEGSDTLVMGQGGVYQLAMTGVEAVTASRTQKGSPDNTFIPSDLTLDGSNTDGFETLNLVSQAANTTLTNFNNGIVNVNASGNFANSGDLTITDIPEVAMTVGDGKSNSSESFTGALTANDAQNISITAESNQGNFNNGQEIQAVFNSLVTASNARSLSLNGGNQSEITIAAGSNLAKVDQIQIAGNGGDITIDGNVGSEAKSVYVNAQNLVGGSVNATFANNDDNDGVLNYYGTNTGTNTVTVDGSYDDVNFYGGANDDVLTIKGTPTAGGNWNVSNLTGDLGIGNDKLILDGPVAQGSNFSGLQGLETIVFQGMTTKDALAFVNNPENNITTGGATVEGSEQLAADDVVVAPGQTDFSGFGGEQTFTGTIDTPNNATINGDNAAAGTTGGVKVDFITTGTPAEGEVLVKDAQNLTVNGGTEANTITGSVANVTGFTLDNTAGTAKDTVVLDVATEGPVVAQGNEVAESTFNMTVTQASSADINAGAADNANVKVSGVSGDIAVTTAGDNATVDVTAPTENGKTVAVNTGTGDDTVDLKGFTAGTSGTLNVDMGEAAEGTTNTLNVADNTDLSGWDTTIKNADITLAGKADLGTLENITDSTITGGTLLVNSDTTLSGDTAPAVSSAITIGKNVTLTVGDNLGATDGITGAISGEGTLEIATGTADLTQEGAPEIKSAVKVDEDATLKVDDLTNTTNISGAGTLEIAGGTKDLAAEVTAANDANISGVTVSVDEFTTLKVSVTNFGEENKFDPASVTGDGTLSLTGDGNVDLTADDATTLSVAGIALAGAATKLTVDEDALKDLGDATISGAGQLVITGDADLTQTGLPTIETGIDVAGTVKVNGDFAPASGTTVSGAGTIEIASGNANWSNSDNIDVAKIQIDEGATLKASTANLDDGAISGEGTFIFDSDTSFGDVSAKFAPAFNNFGIADGETLTFTNATISTKNYHLDGPGTVAVSETADTAEEFNLSSIVLGTGDEALAAFDVSLGASDKVSLGAGAEEIIFNLATDAGSGVAVNGFNFASDKISLASDYAAFGDNFETAAASASKVSLMEADNVSGAASANILANGNIYCLTAFEDVNNETGIENLFTSAADLQIANGASGSVAGNAALNAQAAKFFLEEDESIMLITGKEGSFKLWYINNDSSNTDAGISDSDGEIQLVGTFTSATGAGFAAENFVAGA